MDYTNIDSSSAVYPQDPPQRRSEDIAYGATQVSQISMNIRRWSSFMIAIGMLDFVVSACVWWDRIRFWVLVRCLLDFWMIYVGYKGYYSGVTPTVREARAHLKRMWGFAIVYMVILFITLLIFNWYVIDDNSYRFDIIAKAETPKSPKHKIPSHTPEPSLEDLIAKSDGTIQSILDTNYWKQTATAKPNLQDWWDDFMDDADDYWDDHDDNDDIDDWDDGDDDDWNPNSSHHSGHSSNSDSEAASVVVSLIAFIALFLICGSYIHCAHAMFVATTRQEMLLTVANTELANGAAAAPVQPQPPQAPQQYQPPAAQHPWLLAPNNAALN